MLNNFFFLLVIIPFLTEVAAQNNEAPNLTQRRDVARVLLEAYRGLSGCCILPYLVY